MIFTLLVSLILFSLLKLASKTSKLTASVVDRIYNFAMEGIKTIPIIPTARKPVGIGALEMAFKK